MEIILNLYFWVANGPRMILDNVLELFDIINNVHYEADDHALLGPGHLLIHFQKGDFWKCKSQKCKNKKNA